MKLAKDIQSAGGKARWAKVPAKERSKQMKAIRAKGIKGVPMPKSPQ